MPDRTPAQTGQWARDQLADVAEERRELLAIALESSEQRANDAWKFARLAGGGAALLLLFMLAGGALLLGRTLGFTGLGLDLSVSSEEHE